MEPEVKFHISCSCIPTGAEENPSARVANLQKWLSAARESVDHELRMKAIDYTKIAVYERRTQDLKDELKIYCSTTGELLHSNNGEA